MKGNTSEERILESAINVIARAGLSGTSTRMVAEEAEMTPSNIHYYFKSKSDLFEEVQKRVGEKASSYRQKHVDLRAPESLDEALGVFFLQKMDFIMRETNYDKVSLDLWAQARTSDGLDDLMVEEYAALRREIRETVIEPFAINVPEYEKTLMTYVIVSMLEGASIQYHVKGFNVEGYFSYCKFVVRTMMNALLPE